MGNTSVTTKKEFLEMLDKSIDDDQIIVFTTALEGTSFAASKKVPMVRLPFGFAGDAFKEPRSINAFMRNPVFAVALLPESDLSEHAINLTEKNKRKKLSGANKDGTK